MKSATIILLLFISPIADASESIAHIATLIQQAFQSEQLDQFDNRYLDKQIFLRIEHSIGDEADVKTQACSTWHQVEEWLQSQKIQKDRPGFVDLPQRGEATISGCNNGLCQLTSQMRHNHLFLSEIQYRHTPRGIVITELLFLNGD